MNVIETLISTSVDKMVYKLMHDYNATYDWAVKSVLASETYQRLLKDESFRNESPLYVYQLLIEEFVKAGILDIDDKTKAPR